MLINEALTTGEGVVVLWIGLKDLCAKRVEL